jgi:hypothetical protein
MTPPGYQYGQYEKCNHEFGGGRCALPKGHQRYHLTENMLRHADDYLVRDVTLEHIRRVIREELTQMLRDLKAV